MKRLAIEALRLFSLLLIAVVVPCAEASASTVIITDFPPILVLTGAAGTVTVTAQFLGPITSDYTQFPEQGYIEGSIGEMWSVQTDGLVQTPNGPVSSVLAFGFLSATAWTYTNAPPQNNPSTIAFQVPVDSIQFAMSQFDEQGDNIGYSGVQFTLVFSNGLLPAIPEPSTWAMLLIGFAGIGFVAYRRKAKLALMAA